MGTIQRAFYEFKSIFVTEDLLKENEEHANVVTATTMLNMFWLSLIAWALNYFGVFRIGLADMTAVLLRFFLLLAIPAVICFVLRGKGGWLKDFLFLCFTITLAMIDAILKYNVTLVIAIPLVLSARYYNKKFKEVNSYANL